MGVLARLALNVGQVVTTERLLADVWADSSASTVDKQLHIVVSKLREALPGEVIATVPGGYRLDLPPASVDAHRFALLVRQARATSDRTTAIDLYERALTLWRGAALGGRNETWAQIEAARLEEERLTALEDCVDLRLAAGAHHGVVGELTAHVKAHPLRERPRAQLMLALYRTARPAEALTVYQEARRVMVNELGIEPGVVLRRLHRAVLTGDPSLDLTTEPAAPHAESVVPAELPADTPAFTARSTEFTWLDNLLTTTPADSPNATAPPAHSPNATAAHSPIVAATPARSPIVAAINGPGGIGKSALAVRVAHAASGRFEDGVLYVDLRGASTGLRPMTPIDALGQLLRSLGLDGAAVPSDPAEAAARYRSLTATRRLLVVLDNALDARQVRPLLPAGPACAVIITSRQALVSLDNADHLQLTELDRDDAVTLLARIAGPARVQRDPAAADQIVRLCGGLPLAIRVAAARLAARPDWTPAYLAERLTSASGRLDTLQHADLEVRAAIAVSHHHLREEPSGHVAAQLFTMLGLLELPTYTPDVAAALTDWPEQHAAAALDHLLDARLLEPAGLGRYRMHDLVRLYAQELAARDLPETDRTAAVRQALHHYLGTAKTASLLLDPTSGHALSDYEADRPGIPLAGAQEAGNWTYQECDNLVAAARQAAAVHDDPQTAIGLACALYWPFTSMSLNRELIDIHTRALEIAISCGDLAAQGLEHNLLGIKYQAMGQFSTAAEHLEQALACWARADRPRRRISAYNGLAINYAQLERYDEALDALEKGQALAEAGKLPDFEAIFLNNRAMIYRKLGRLADAITTVQASLALLANLDNPSREGNAYDTLADAYRRSGRLYEAESAYRTAIELQHKGRHHLWEATSAWGLGQTYHDMGRHDEAWTWWRRSLDMLREVELLTQEEVEQVLTQALPDIPHPIKNIL
ncbi:BTAD domain-containing putative transcriptional regulator [Nonomuraea sp. NPDC050404]|uniref:AfsR/SARP family transcriptional regulator n=1 Tax=Nonomuraea sp. NPDC050404 TaxID=3155783 RepID=UPI0033C7CD0E